MILLCTLVFMIYIVKYRQNPLQCQAPKLKFCRNYALSVYADTDYGT